MSYPAVEKTVLITGCSSGIGEASARMLREAGWTVYPTARRAEDLERLRAEGYPAIELDTASADSCARAVESVLEQSGGTLGALVNNAGFGQAGAMEDIDRDTLRYQFEVNFIGMHDLSQRLIPVFRKAGGGRIVNISSVVGRMALPFLGAYSASKFAMEAISDSMRIELREAGIMVSLVEPGPIVTAFRKNCAEQTDATVAGAESAFGAFYEHELKRRRDRQKKIGFINRPPEDVGKKVRHALESARPRRRYCVTLPAYAGAWMRRFAPYSLTDAILARQVKKSSKSKA